MIEKPYQVRGAVGLDASELARLRWEFRMEERPRQARHEFLEECERWLEQSLASGQWVVAVAEAEGRLFGSMYLERVAKLPVPGKIRRAWGYITSSYVHEDWRGHGVGRQMLDLLVDAGRARDLEFLILWPSPAAIPFYERAGFRSLDELHSGPGDAPPVALRL